MNEWMKQRDLLIEEALAFAQAVAANAPKMAVTPVQPSPLAYAAATPLQRLEVAPQDKLDTEGSVIRKRLANFKAHQERFQREREDYFQKTMAKARTYQWTPPIDNK
jgi:hypothetical protein